MSLLEGKIKNSYLTKTEKIIAEYIVNNQDEVLFMTSSNLAAKIGVSDTSIIRFTKKIGYNGFNEFKKELKSKFSEVYIKKNDIFTSPIELLVKNAPSLKESVVIEQFFNISLKNMKEMMEKNELSKFDEAAKLLYNSNRKFISGFRGCIGLAEWMAFILSHMLTGVISNTESGAIAFEKVIDANNSDVLVLFSLERYNKIGIDLVKLMKNNNSKIIVITDKLTAPVAEYADVIFIAPKENLSFFNSHISSLFICESILNSTSKLIGTSNDKRLELIEEYIKPYGFY